MLNSPRQRGNQFEALAQNYLSRQGLQPLESNFLVKSGELDLIMRDKQTIVFVEVRYRRNQNFGHAAETVTPAKQRKLLRAANVWLQSKGLSVHSCDFRFDVVAIHEHGQQIDWIKNAITQG